MNRFKYLLITICLAATLTACDNSAAKSMDTTGVGTTNESSSTKEADIDNSDSDSDSIDNSTANNSDSLGEKDDTSNSKDGNVNNDTLVINNVSENEQGTPFENHGKLTLNGTSIVDCNNKAFQLHGVSTHGIAWFPQYVNADAFATLRDEWGVNCIRLAMYSDENNGYCSGGNKDNLKQLVKDGVKYATDLGMYVIIDWHVLGDHDPNVHKDEAKLFFDEMSKLYADNDHVLYEICNEPNGGVKWSSVKSYAEEVIAVIRKNSPDSLIIVGTPTWSQDVDIAAKDPITDYNNILYAIHFYADTHKKDLRNKAQKALDKGLPLFCSEFGICDASGNGKCNEKEADKWIDFFDKNNVSYCIWNLSNKDESSALIKSNCSKTSGWTMDDLSQEGQWYVNSLSSKTNGSRSSAISNSSNNDNSDTNSIAADNDTSSNSSNSSSSGNLSVDIDDSNSWNDGNNDFVQYNVTIKNTDSTADAIGWKVIIEFENKVEIDQSWNGIYKVSGNSIIITPVDYNSTVAAGSSQKDIGFIVKSDKDIAIKKICLV